jgi:hypothetical protein
MTVQLSHKLLILAAALCFHPGVGMAEEAFTTSLHCAIKTCSPQEACKKPYELGSYSMNVDAGNEFIFLVTDNWSITPEVYKLENLRFSPEGYRSRTTVNIDVNRRSKEMKMSVSLSGIGIKTSETTITGTCDFSNAIPIIF